MLTHRRTPVKWFPLLVLALVFLVACSETNEGTGVGTDDLRRAPDVGGGLDVQEAREVAHDMQQNEEDANLDPGDDAQQPVDALDVQHSDQEAPDVGEPDTGCKCYQYECGTTPDGCYCGECPGGQVCDTGECVPEVSPDGTNGAYCGPTPDCHEFDVDPVTGDVTYNPGFQACANGQCNSNMCGTTSPALLHAPACMQPCLILMDEVNNVTGAVGPDGIEDPDSVFSECYGFTDGPAGANWVCANYAAPNDTPAAYCTPGTSFAFCDSDADCPPDEQCNYSFINQQFATRCQARLKSSGGMSASALSGMCTFNADEVPATYCDSGICTSGGCMNLCVTDADCDTTQVLPWTGCDPDTKTCKTNPAKSCDKDLDCSLTECSLLGAQLFNQAPELTVDLCWWK